MTHDIKFGELGLTPEELEAKQIAYAIEVTKAHHVAGLKAKHAHKLKMQQEALDGAEAVMNPDDPP